MLKTKSPPLLKKLIPVGKVFVFLILWFLIRGIILAPLFVLNIIETGDLGAEQALYKNIVFSGTALLSLILAISIANKCARQWKPSAATLGITHQYVIKETGKGLFIGSILLLACFLCILAFDNLGILYSGPDYSSTLTYALLFIIVAVSEELLIRGYLLSYFQKHYGTLLAVLVTSIFFVCIHLTNDHVDGIAITHLFLSGVFLSLLFVHYQNLWVPIGVHFAWNFLQGPVLGFAVSGNDTSSIFRISLAESTILNGGDFGIEGSVFTIGIQVVAIVLLYGQSDKLRSSLNLYRS